MNNQIYGIQQQNFNGAFLIKFPKSKSAAGLQNAFDTKIESLGLHFHKFAKFEGDTDKFLYVFKSFNDINIAKFLEENRITGVTYYPTVTTSVIPCPNIKKAQEYFKANNPLQIKTVRKMLDYIKENFPDSVAQYIGIKKNSTKPMKLKKLAEILNFSLEGAKHRYYCNINVSKYTSEQGGRLIISPVNANGYRYIKKIPKTGHGATEYKLVNAQNGETIYDFTGPDKVISFHKGFSNAINYYQSTLKKQ